MKRIAILFILMFAVVMGSSAQTTQRQKMFHMVAVRLAEQIDVNESDRDTFVSLYQEYKKECAEVLKIAPETAADSEKAAEAKILCDFDKSARILALRKSYYWKFRKILSPTQI